MSSGNRNRTSKIAQVLERGKALIDITETGTRVYKSEIGDGKDRITVLWHDNRQFGIKSQLIIKSNSTKPKHYELSDLSSQKAVYEFAESKIIELSI